MKPSGKWSMQSTKHNGKKLTKREKTTLELDKNM